MRKLTLLITMVIMVLCVGNVQAQDKKAERKARQAERLQTLNDRFIDVIESGNYRFNVSTIDASIAPQLAYMPLRGGYYITVKNKELTANLPFSGPNVYQGNAPTFNELGFTTTKYSTGLTHGGNGGIDATITAIDPKTNNSYTFVIKSSTARETLVVYAMGMNKICYFGGLIELRKTN